MRLIALRNRKYFDEKTLKKREKRPKSANKGGTYDQYTNHNYHRAICRGCQQTEELRREEMIPAQK